MTRIINQAFDICLKLLGEKEILLKVIMLNENQKRDLEIINSPHEWASDCLCLINRSKGIGDKQRYAFLVRGHGSKLYIGNIFEYCMEDGYANRPEFDGFDITEFANFESILEAGWEVD